MFLILFIRFATTRGLGYFLLGGTSEYGASPVPVPSGPLATQPDINPDQSRPRIDSWLLRVYGRFKVHAQLQLPQTRSLQDWFFFQLFEEVQPVAIEAPCKIASIEQPYSHCTSRQSRILCMLNLSQLCHCVP